MIERNLNREFHAATKPSIDFIAKILDDAYKSGLKYDVCDLMPAVKKFAKGSTHHADYCVKAAEKMKFVSKNDNTEIKTCLCGDSKNKVIKWRGS